ncbi:hypothetical protein GTP56_26125 [Duganella sp. FT134W]|uniref:Uncharacterized protein n=1 Tax=Duganella margarita TaxID=2692170 RepID=A0A7X4H5B1_9BURK|nr:hypothetical protein [Duganella margarita]MYM75648.1 hypothetical protein [Duganella margarita]
MKDSLLLLLTGIVCAAGAWLFFRYFGQEAFGILMLVALIGAIADNARLRRRLREMGAKPEGKRTWL